MKQFNGFEAKKAAGEREYLPVGGYVAKILDAKEITYDWGNVIQISFDVIEGPCKDFFKNDYNGQTAEDKKWRGTYRLREPSGDGSEKDGWTRRTFGNSIWSIESSNSGYHFDWDESKFKGKIVGVLFRNAEWEYDGKTGWRTECCALTDVESIRAGKFRTPKDKPLKKQAETASFAEVSPADSDDLPF